MIPQSYRTYFLPASEAAMFIGISVSYGIICISFSLRSIIFQSWKTHCIGIFIILRVYTFWKNYSISLLYPKLSRVAVSPPSIRYAQNLEYYNITKPSIFPHTQNARWSRTPYHSLVKLPRIFSAIQVFHPSSFPVPFSLSSNPPSALVYPQHSPVRGPCMYSASPQYRYAPPDTGAPLDSYPISPCCCSKYGGRHPGQKHVHQVFQSAHVLKDFRKPWIPCFIRMVQTHSSFHRRKRQQ